MYVTDPNDPSVLVPPGEKGEVCIGGIQVARKYHRHVLRIVRASKGQKFAKDDAIWSGSGGSEGEDIRVPLQAGAPAGRSEAPKLVGGVAYIGRRAHIAASPTLGRVQGAWWRQGAVSWALRGALPSNLPAI